MQDLTQRQIDILKAIIKEYTESGEAVGSEILEKKYKLGVSPATIRNEMVELAKKGYLKKAHFSSGRIPSAKGFRFYIQHLMKEKELSTMDEVAYKNSIWDERNQIHRLLSLSTRVLASRTGLLSIIATSTGDVYYAGVANLLDKDEFLDLDVSRNIFGLLDEMNFWDGILRQFYKMNEDIMYMLGEEDFRNPAFESCASVFGEFESDNVKGIIGVVGPKRMYYDVIIPQVRYFSHLIGQIVREQRT
jgi:heat-inducible transcriptional repressor